MACLIKRDLSKAFEKMQQVINTYNFPELMSYELFARYICLTGLLSLSWVDFKKKILNNFDLIAVFNEDKIMSDFVNCVYYANYKEFFAKLTILDENFLSKD